MLQKKKKILWGNEKPHMSKSLRRAIMKSSKLKNRSTKPKNPLDTMNYKKQRDFMTKLNKTAKLEYFNNLKLGKGNKPIEKWRNANFILLISTIKLILTLC